MPHVPYQPRPLPPGVEATPPRTVAPTTTKETTVTEVAPSYAELTRRVPTRRKPPKTRSNVRFPDQEPPVSVKAWDVDPARIAFEIGVPSQP